MMAPASCRPRRSCHPLGASEPASAAEARAAPDGPSAWGPPQQGRRASRRIPILSLKLEALARRATSPTSFGATNSRGPSLHLAGCKAVQGTTASSLTRVERVGSGVPLCRSAAVWLSRAVIDRGGEATMGTGLNCQAQLELTTTGNMIDSETACKAFAIRDKRR